MAYTVDRSYITNDKFNGLPVVPFEELISHYAPDSAKLFVAVGYNGINALRAEKVAAAREMGYQLATYVSSKATTFEGFEPGDNCFILENNTIQPFVKIGENVTLWSGNHIGHHSVIEDDCFIASHVVVSGNCTIGAASFIGVNATLRDNVKIGTRSVIGAGAVILGDVEPEGVYPAASTTRAKVPSSRLRKI